MSEELTWTDILKLYGMPGAFLVLGTWTQELVLITAAVLLLVVSNAAYTEHRINQKISELNTEKSSEGDSK